MGSSKKKRVFKSHASKFQHYLRSQSILTNYSNKNRLIPQKVYIKKKTQKKCSRCKRKREHNEFFEVHHIIPVCEGGSNEENNLKGLCVECHEIEDKKQMGDSDERT